MAVSFRSVGTWAELIADGTVAIPATPQAGDRMYLFARWKDFSVTATVANWTELTEFADGVISAGNGTGSVKVACWYRDWQSGDTDPTIDFSANPDNASAVIMVMQKDADDVWGTPVARTAAMTNWTTTSQTVSASATAVVPSGGVVMGLIGLRDDSAVMTRPTTGIDDSAGAVTWNGNYVESPATHHSTTTGFDGAADLGYRLVSVGATATLRMTGTISAAETGAALWVIQDTTIVVTPAPAALTLSTLTPTIRSSVTPATANLELSTFAPTLRSSVAPSPALLEVATSAPLLRSSVVPATASFELTSFAPTLVQSVTPARANLTISTFSPSLINAVTPAPQSFTITLFTPTLAQAVTPATLNLILTTFRPSIWPPNIIFLDPGGDAVQAVGYFNTLVSDTVTFDTAQKVVGVGSWKFASGAENRAARVAVNGVLGSNRRGSFYWRYDSVPDATATLTEFAESAIEAYSGDGFDQQSNLAGDEGGYATATPAKNAGQGTVFGAFGLDSIPVGAIIDLVKIIYERKYDTDTSIGISRVKWRVNGEEGPNHDNTAMPLTDTVVEVDVTSDRGAWERQDLLNGVFEVIAEARRGDTDTAHTQSWDYLKVEVVYHIAVPVFQARDALNIQAFELSTLPSGAGVRIRFSDGAANSYDGITELATNTWNRISYAYTNPVGVADDLHIKIYVNSIQELDIIEAPTNGVVEPANIIHGWCSAPGENKNCWFEQLAMDEGDDLTDIGNVLMTAKPPATVNNNNFDTTGGTGAVNERPVDLANFRQQAATAQVDQDYTIQAANVGDVDISGESLIGHMGWLIAKKSSTPGGTFGFILNGAVTSVALPSTVTFLKLGVTDTNYLSNAAGIGLRSSTGSQDAFLYECGVVVAYEGPPQNVALFPWQLLTENSVTPVTDDLRSELPDTYELLLEVSESGAQVSVEVYAITSEDQEPQLRQTLHCGGGSAREPINNPGIEISLVIRVEGANAYVRLRRRLNV